ncbi:TAXI family TRAP transporter solute-binding subunit [Kaistia defluvii]|uniref:TRAP transporter TAXI family solute receptor n=1 Tax=Kaistia defluvii TaxID=410841 RepID=A0ABV2QXQ3_9HYPH
MSNISISRRRLFAIGAGAAGMAVLPALVQAASPMRAWIVTGGKGGVFYPYGQGLAEVLSSAHFDSKAEATGGSVDNARLVQAGKADIGFSTVDSAYDALHGTGAYAKDGKLDLRVLAVLYDSYLHVVASRESGIASIADLKGKRVSIGSAGSSTEAIADRVLEAAGIDPASGVTRANLGVAESAVALKDGKIDAFFWIGGVPTAAVAELASAGKPAITFVPTGVQHAAIDRKYPGLYRELTLPKSAYAGMTANVPSLGVANVLIVSASATDDFVTAVLTGIFDNLDAVHKVHPEAARLALDRAASTTAVPFHPAATAFYKARGA